MSNFAVLQLTIEKFVLVQDMEILQIIEQYGSIIYLNKTSQGKVSTSVANTLSILTLLLKDEVLIMLTHTFFICCCLYACIWCMHARGWVCVYMHGGQECV